MTSQQLDLSQYHHTFGLKNKIGRLVWNICYWPLLRLFPPVFNVAKIGASKHADLFILPTFSENFGIVVAKRFIVEHL